MVDFSFDEFWNAPPGYMEHHPGFIIGRTAIDVACRFYAQHPATAQALVSALPAPSPMEGFIFPRMCRMPPPPAAPAAPPFQGGQCCELYRVRCNVTSSSGTQSITFENQPGQIGSIFVEYSDVDGVRGKAYYFMAGLRCSGVVPAKIFVASEVRSDDLPFTTTATIASVSRMDNQPDSCGNPLPVHPPGVVPPEDFDWDGVAPFPDGDRRVPVRIIPPQPQGDVIIRPEINIEAGDVIVNVTGEGITFGVRNPAPNLPPNNNVPPGVPTGSNPPPNQPLFPPSSHPAPGGGGDPGGGGNCPDVNLQPVLNAIANVDADLKTVGDNVILLLDCDRCKPEEPEESAYQRQSFGVAQSRTIQLPPNSKYVELVVVERPSNAKVQFSPSAQNVYYCGWQSFGHNAKADVRNPVHYEENIFLVPDGMTEFSYTLYAGFRAQLTAVFLVEK